MKIIIYEDGEFTNEDIKWKDENATQKNNKNPQMKDNERHDIYMDARNV